MTYSDQIRPGHIRENQTKCFLGPIIVHLSPMVRIMGFETPNKTFSSFKSGAILSKSTKRFSGILKRGSILEVLQHCECKLWTN